MSKRNRVDGEALRPAGMIPVERVVDAEKEVSTLQRAELSTLR
jgi:hypothetical protein